MDDDTINLYEAIRWMEAQKEPFRVEFITTSLSKGTGGQVKVIDRALCGAIRANVHKEHMIGLVDLQSDDATPIHTYIYSLCYINGKRVEL